MIKLTADPKIKYYETGKDLMWLAECQTIIPWLDGKGADIGAGTRSINPDVIRVDIDKKVHPDILSSGDELPFKDGELDYITSIHSFEHFDDQQKTLKEWLRVVRVGGYICIVHPDLFFTHKQNPVTTNVELQRNPFNYHFHEHTQESFNKMIEKWTDFGFDIVDTGIACGNWSFYVILRKIA